MSATSDHRLARLEENLREIRVEVHALQIAMMERSGFAGLAKNGYAWAYYKAEKEERDRERAEGEREIAGVDLSLDSVLAAARTASSSLLHGHLSALEVAAVLCPKAADAQMPGRQLLIARVGMRIRELVEQGQLVRISEPAGRKTARYAVREAVAS